MVKTVRTPKLEIAYQEFGPTDGAPVILLHGWPSDPHDWDGVAPPLAASGCRVLVPWLRGFGPTQFLDSATPRSGQQAALGSDVRDFMDALGIRQALLGGYDWGGRGACVTAALWPERVLGLVSINGYSIQNIPSSGKPAAAAQEHRHWYQWYFHTERGRAGLRQNGRDIARLLWRLWSPNWHFDEATFVATAESFRESRFCRCDDPVLSASLWQRPRRSDAGCVRTASGRTTFDYGADHCAARCVRWGRSS